MKKIPLSQGKFAIVDDEDYSQLSTFKWSAQKGRHTFYAVRRSSVSEGRKTILMHRQLMGLSGKQIDHRDENGLNNRRNNLRTATHAQNLRNRGKQKNNTTGFKGVYFYSRKNVFQAYITVDGKRRTIGQFKTAKEAHVAYQKAASRLHGEFARFQ